MIIFSDVTICHFLLCQTKQDISEHHFGSWNISVGIFSPFSENSSLFGEIISSSCFKNVQLHPSSVLKGCEMRLSYFHVKPLHTAGPILLYVHACVGLGAGGVSHLSCTISHVSNLRQHMFISCVRSWLHCILMIS